MLNYNSVVGSKEVWAGVITNVDMGDTPIIDWLPETSRPKATVFHYQADEYADPEENSAVDGRPVTGFAAAGEGREELVAYSHNLKKTASVTRLHQDFTDIDGITNELSREITKKTKELGRDLEAHLGDDIECRADNSIVGFKTRSIGDWIQATAQTTEPVPAAFRPPAASIDATATGSWTEQIVLNVLESMGSVNKTKQPITAFCGFKAKRAFNNLPLFTPASTLIGGTPTVGGYFQKSLQGRAVERLIERYVSDFGPVDLIPTWWLMYFTGGSYYPGYTTYFMHQPMWAWSWQQKPEWRTKPYQGGAQEAFCEALGMLVCWNPQGEGKMAPAS